MQDRGVEFDTVNYLETPLSKEELLSIIGIMGADFNPAEMVRTQEARFKELGLSPEDIASEEAVADLLACEPTIMQRPIVRIGQRARICRPAELVTDLLDG